MPELHFTGFKRIIADPEHCDGQPRIAGTRITVAAILSYLAGGMTVEQIAAEYPVLSTKDVYEALAFAAAQFQDRFLPLRLASE
ncbi:MAG: DUF433 domain-containing protein [Bacteroidetes bacterium]|nr:MAG: DUF433 domain-containing protein [Bacteroidota bacterium]